MTFLATRLFPHASIMGAIQAGSPLIVRKAESSYQLTEHSPSSSEEISTSLHECAHAVVAIALGSTVKQVSLRDDGSGLCDHDPGSLSAVDLATISLAGPVAECLHTGEQFEWGRFFGATFDELHVEVAIGKGITTHDVESAQKRAELLVTLLWPPINQLAAKLRKYRSIRRPLIDSFLNQLKAGIPST